MPRMPRNGARIGWRSGAMALMGIAFLVLVLKEDDQIPMPASDLPPEIAHNLGTYSARYTVDRFGAYRPISPDLPDGCKVIQVNVLHRPVSCSPIKRPPSERLSFLRHWNLPPGSNVLVPFGRKGGYVSGIQTAKTYQSLAVNSAIFVRTTNLDRVIETSRWFLQGFHGGKYPVPRDKLLSPNVIIPIGIGNNNTLSCKLCGTDDLKEDEYSTRTKKAKVADKWLAVYAPAIITRLQSYVRGLILTNEDVQNLMSLCGFETAYLDGAPSAWCTVFKDEEWSAYEYWHNLDVFPKMWRT
ncbi:hypothetical protein FRB93_013865 [Tulasnella sp. JGI-2019a]|nr:hypothetical protein FRB93_013865 [Tulasnella sp. JGI-2019a]